MEGCLKSSQKYLFGMPIEILVTDDGSCPEELVKMNAILKKYPNLLYIKKEKANGIVECVQKLTEKANGLILMPLSADMRFVSQWWILRLLLVFLLHSKICLVFGKTRLLDFKSEKIIGTVGWSHKKGKISAAAGIDGVCEGTIRVAGGSVAYRKRWFLQHGGFKPAAGLGPKSDFYINHLAILQGQGWYIKKVGAVLLEGRPSYSTRFRADEYREFCKKTVQEWEKENIHFSEYQKRKYLQTEERERLVS